MWISQMDVKIFKGFYCLVLISFSLSLIASTYGLYCHVCSSDKLEDCATLRSIEDLPTELCPSNSASCFTKIEHGITIRGCTRSTGKISLNTDFFAICKSNNCNAQNFPADRLSCLHCEGGSCANQSNSIEMRYPCVNYHPNDQCYSIISHDGSMAYRGCMSDEDKVGKDFCSMNFAQCHTCSGRACNSNLLKFETAISCVKCNPDASSDCNLIDENIEAAECAATTFGYKNACYIYKSDGIVQRGCLYEASDDIFNECNNEFVNKCLLCNHNNCNRMPIINSNTIATKNERNYTSESESNIQYETCIECNSNDDDRCRTKPEALQGNVCKQGRSTESEGCYLNIAEDRVQRGCITDLSSNMKTICVGNSNDCKSCVGNNCNAKVKFHECYNCNSKTDLQCSRDASLTDTKTCRTYYSECLTGIDRNGYTHRRCTNQQKSFKREFSDNLILCDDEKCNVKIYPKGILKCYQCNGKKECDLTEGSKLKPQRCTMLSQYDQCFTYVNQEKKIFRGCLSDQSETRLLCDRADKHENGTCVKCRSDSCNNQPRLRKPNLSCMSCTETETKECAFGQDSSKAIACENQVVFGDKETCFTRFVNDTQNVYHVTRGCTLDSNSEVDWCKDEVGCKKCSEPGCNNENARWSFCIHCSSVMNGDCAIISKLDDYTVKCEHSSYPFSKRGCYTDKRDGKINRGCIADLSAEYYQRCQSDNETCKLCTENNCNKEDVNSSEKISTVPILYFFVLLIVYI
ncbi:uncharacterized protein LOC116341726 [Contarinia nasturtii]|uniref:uncharacterized protein LOC116341726 n=1 Tax=Contarinia nasturtii TaxID=265458 RepID=UPI0012D4A6C7|nr:uncharacterized protein LOC116341726 [Contarinia nasturtii]